MKKITKKEMVNLLKLLDSKAVSITATLENGVEITINKKTFDKIYSGLK